MSQGKLQPSSGPLLIIPSQFQGLGLMWGLCIVNIGLILLLGGMMMILSTRIEFFIITLAMMLSAGSMVILLLIKLQKLKFTSRAQHIEALAYETMQSPTLILGPDLHFCNKNKMARQNCWWAENILFMKKLLKDNESKEALERLIENLNHQRHGEETLYFLGENGEEVWRIKTFSFLEGSALWQCTNMTSKMAKQSQHLKQLTTIKQIFDHTAQGLFSLDEKGNILFCNTKFANWLGYTPEQIEGSSISKFLVKLRGQSPIKLIEIQGKSDFISSSSRVKSAFLEQDLISTDQGLITYSIVNINHSFASYSDLRRVIELAPFPVILLDWKGKIQDSNLLFRERYWPEDQPIQGASFLDCVIDSQKEEVKHVLYRNLEGKNEGGSFEISLSDSKESIVSTHVVALQVKNQAGLILQFHDITEQKRFETQLVQSQKMQAVGQLAGGIAHDFNNLLTAMIGFCDLMLLRQTPGDQLFTDVMQIKQNATRATNLVRQLLAFSRQQPIEPSVLNITESLTELSALLRRLLGANVELKIKYARDLGLVFVDKGHFEQVIINIMVNARDAMLGGGTITLTTQNYEFKKSKRYRHGVIPAGNYVLMEISDTGEGIKPEIIDRIFDPFFSTKEVGSGTGLGLSTVYGIIKQAGGFIQVDSTVGKGSTFSIYLPHCTPEEASKALLPKEGKAQLQDLTGSSTIMLVEDEDAVRLFSARALRSKGYKVIEAINGEEALEYMKSNSETIDLVISDVIMPNMDGPTFVNEMNRIRENQKVLFISGYAEDTFYDRIQNEAKIQFLAKPFTLIDLATRVKQILNDENLMEGVPLSPPLSTLTGTSSS